MRHRHVCLQTRDTQNSKINRENPKQTFYSQNGSTGPNESLKSALQQHHVKSYMTDIVCYCREAMGPHIKIKMLVYFMVIGHHGVTFINSIK